MADSKAPIDDNDDEYELEPVDPEVLAIERERGERRTETAVSRIDVDELYGDTSNYSDFDVNWSELRQFRFTTQHLLILTAVLAILLTLFRLFDPGLAIFVIAAVLLAGGWFGASLLERRKEAERERRRAEFFGKGAGVADATNATFDTPVTQPRAAFKFAFSTKELLITMTAAAVALALLRFIGPHTLSMVLGMIALAGLAANAMGYDPPRQVVLGWWILLVMYLAVGLIAALVNDESSAGRRLNEPPPWRIAAASSGAACDASTA
jgi:membrane protein implicated in regulation of membrane protease activity